MFDRITDLTFKQMIAIPILVVIVMATIGVFNPPSLGMDLSGGNRITITNTDYDSNQLEQYLQGDLNDDRVNARSLEGVDGIIVESPADIDQDTLIDSIMQETNVPGESISTEAVSASFGRSTQIQGITALGIAFLGMIVVVFITFRDIVPSLTIIYCAFSDMIIAVGLMSLLGVPLTLGTIAALLMLIGYAVDSNILLTTRILKRSGSFADKYSKAIQTGIMMAGTTLSVLVVIVIVNSSQILDSIAIVLILGIISDFMNTWFFNGGILRWRTEGQ